MSTTTADYRTGHRPAGPDYGAPLHDVTGMFGADFYENPQFSDYGEPEWSGSARAVLAAKGNPDALVTIYRAVPPTVPQSFAPGDWVAVTPGYAQAHGEGPLSGDYTVISARVRAGDLWSDGGSLCEWGYHGNQTTTDQTGAIA